eukprot:1115033-Prymnesium_polylepis.1
MAIAAGAPMPPEMTSTDCVEPSTASSRSVREMRAPPRHGRCRSGDVPPPYWITNATYRRKSIARA